MAAPGVTTLATIRTRARQRADLVNSTFVTDAEFNGWISDSYAELYDLLTQKYGDDYFVAGTPDNWYQLTTTSSTGYPLPDGTSTYTLQDGTTIAQAFYKLLGVDVKMGSDWTALRPFQIGERNMRGTLTGSGWWRWLRYKVSGNYLWLMPPPQSGQTLRVFYCPRPYQLSDSGTITLSGVVATDTVTINGVTFTAVAAGAVGTQFNVGGTDTITATNLTTTINAQAAIAAVLTATSSGAVVTLTLILGTVSWSPGNSHLALALPTTSSSAPTSWSNQVDGVSGWEEYVVVDAAAKALVKEESDPSALFVAKAALILRIEAAAANRDAGAPQRVQDIWRRDSPDDYREGFY